jgi:hypothetical protein
MFDHRGAWLLAATAVLAAGCARPTVAESPPVFAAGAAGIERTAPCDAEEAWTVVLRTLRRNGFAPVRADHDGLGGDLAARRADRLVFVRVRKLDPDRTLLSVRSEPPDPGLSRELHEAFAIGLGLGVARRGLFGGNSAELRADLTIDEALRRAREAMKALRIEETGLERKDDEAEVRGRTFESIPVSILLASDGPRAIEATFVVGARKRDAHLALAERMKQEFERRS